MSLEAKVQFLNNLEKSLSYSVPAASMSKILSIVSDTLQSFDLVHCADADTVGSTDLFDAFITAMQVEGRSPNTIKQYTYTINRLLNDLQVPVRNITAYHIRAWLSKEKDRGISDGTLKSNRTVFCSFFGWLFREGLIERNPVSNIGTIKAQKKVLEAYSAIDLDRLRAACSDPRNLALLHLLMATGCRISEIIGMDREDVDFQLREIVVLGKGNKERTVYFNEVAASHPKAYLATRTDDNPALILNRRRERISKSGVRFILKKITEAAGITTHVHPHKFRRTLATTMISHGAPIQQVAAILGHEKLDTTMKYVVMDKSAVKSSYQKYT